MSWSKIVFGGAGPRTNARRRDVINNVTELLEQWRDTDNSKYLVDAIDLLNGESK